MGSARQWVKVYVEDENRSFESRGLFLDRYFRFHRIRNETFRMREMVHLIELLLRRLFLTGKLEFWVQLHPGDRHLAVLILFHVADRFIHVFVENELLFAGDSEESEHMAARE